ncbi:MAG: hypothetical protein LBH68_03345 [Bifidobacteriaceae bacterium]|nr:hypothetical protein [Bifidobacteriaceae bacterium]
MAGCQKQSNDAGVEPVVTFDWVNVEIGMPLDAYGTCIAEERNKFVWVGRGVIFSRWEVLGMGWMTPYDEAAKDRRWKAAGDEWIECVVEKGYPAPEELFGLLVPEDASAEVAAKSRVDAARCSDENGIAKKLAEVEAEYQVKYINEHEAELVEIQRRTQQMVEEAKVLVKEAGFSW